MTEALAGLSIAVNVMQVIAFSRDTIFTIKRLYDNKPLVPGATEDSQSFSELIAALREDRTPTYEPSQQDKDLNMVAEQALEVAEQIQGISQDYQAVLGASKAKRLVRGLGKALKYNLLDKSKVKDLEFTLSKLQHLMLFHILVDLRQHVKAGKIIESAEFHNLDHKVQYLTKRLEVGIPEMEHFLGQGPKSLQVEAVTKPGAISSSNEREAIDSSAYIFTDTRSKRRRSHDIRSAKINDFERERLLQSLQFPGMHARARALDSRPAHDGTFEWIYGASQSDDESYSMPWDDFTQWLQSGEPIYWISGKPGSGKSTFMRFLINDVRTLKLLKVHGDACIIASFIWTAGSHMQRSLRGLLCVLLHALVTETPSLMQCSGLDERMYSKTCPKDWSSQELECTLHSLVQSRAEPVCIFIDGLDEIDPGISDGQGNLLDVIKRLSTLNGIKLCLSSRPEIALKSELCAYPHMKLQDLTRGDILRLVMDQLNTPKVVDWIQYQQQYGASRIDDHEGAEPTVEYLVHAIVERAEGIFLWVCLVTQSIRRGVLNCDDWKLLIKRVHSLPLELESLYENLWQRQEKDSDIYRTHVAVYLNTISDLRYYSVTALHILFVVEPDLSKRLLAGGAYVSSVEIYRRMQELRRQIDARCCGLLEFWSEPETLLTCSSGCLTEEEATQRLYCNIFEEKPISLIHRSALDFLLTTSKGQEIRSYDRRSRLESESANFLAELACRVLLGQQEYMHVVSLRIDQLYGSFYFDTSEYFPSHRHTHKREGATNMRILVMKLCHASLDRLSRERDHPDLIICSAGWASQRDVTMHAASHMQQAHISDANQLYSKLLLSSLHGLCGYDSADCNALVKMEQLLEHGANPNTIISPHPRTDEMNLPPLAACLYRAWIHGMTTQVDGHALGEVFKTLFDHGLDISARFIGSAGPASHMLAFARVFQDVRGTELNENCPGQVAVLYDMDYSHFLRFIFRNSLLKEIDNMEGCHFMKEVLDQNISSRPKAIMLVQASIQGRKITSLSAKLIAEQHSDCILEHLTSKPHATSSLYEIYPSEVLDEQTIVKWLVKHKYMSPSALRTTQTLSVLVKDAYRANFSAGPHNRAAVNFTYSPEYDDFVKAIDERVRRQLARD